VGIVSLPSLIATATFPAGGADRRPDSFGPGSTVDVNELRVPDYRRRSIRHQDRPADVDTPVRDRIPFDVDPDSGR